MAPPVAPSTDSEFHVSERVEDEHGNMGTVRWVGCIAKSPAPTAQWVGVEWDDPTRGKYDGSIYGERYFSTPSPTGASFIKPSKLIKGVPFTTAFKQKYNVDYTGRSHIRVQCKRLLEMGEDGGFTLLQNADLSNQRISLSCTVGQSIHALCPNLVELSLARNLLSHWGEVLEIVKSLPKLRSLNLSQNRFSESYDSDHGSSDEAHSPQQGGNTNGPKQSKRRSQRKERLSSGSGDGKRDSPQEGEGEGEGEEGPPKPAPPVKEVMAGASVRSLRVISKSEGAGEGEGDEEDDGDAEVVLTSPQLDSLQSSFTKQCQQSSEGGGSDRVSTADRTSTIESLEVEAVQEVEGMLGAGWTHPLEVLILNGTMVTWERVNSLCRLFPQLRELHLGGQEFSTVELAMAPPTLEYLNLSGNKIDSWEQVNQLGTLPNLQVLLLRRNNIRQIAHHEIPLASKGRTAPPHHPEPPPRSEEHYFPSLSVLSLDHNPIMEWGSLENLDRLFLDEVNVKELPLFGATHEADVRKETIARLSSVAKVNRSGVSMRERETAERHFVRLYSTQAEQPPSYFRLRDAHGDLKPLANIRMKKPDDQISVVYKDAPVEGYHPNLGLCNWEFLVEVGDKLGLKAQEMVAFHKSPYDFQQMVYPERKLHAYRILEGDEIHVFHKDDAPHPTKFTSSKGRECKPESALRKPGEPVHRACFGPDYDRVVAERKAAVAEEKARKKAAPTQGAEGAGEGAVP